MQDVHFMRTALSLSRRNLGSTAPNPSVGCVIVKDGIVIGRGVTGIGGRPHAETTALAQAQGAAQGATAYVTLEPCCHHGSTGPCTDTLIAAGIARVVIATRDPDSRVAGNGIHLLKRAGIEVITGICEAEALELHQGFFLKTLERRPLVTLKLASTLDGRIAMPSGESQWITGNAARHYTHHLRSEHDAIMVGSGTVLADDPLLTCRIPGLEHHSPIRVIMDGNFRTPITAKLVTTARTTPTWIMTHTEPLVRKDYEAYGVEIMTFPATATKLDVTHMVAALADKGITRLLVEGGSTLAASFLQAQLVDHIIWFHAPMVIGASGLAGVGPLVGDLLSAMPHFTLHSTKRIGHDIVSIMHRKTTVE